LDPKQAPLVHQRFGVLGSCRHKRMDGLNIIAEAKAGETNCFDFGATGRRWQPAGQLARAKV